MPDDVDVIVVQRQLQQHIDDCEVRHGQHDERLSQLLTSQEKTNDCIRDLSDSTKGLVDAWQTANGMGRFIKWVSSLGIAGAGLLWLVEHFQFRP